jgi:hypothetical protein
MSYDIEQLSAFIPLLDPEKREGTSYIELHPTERPDPHSCWLPGSLMLRDSAFDFYTESFYHADPDFDYFAFQKLNESEIQALASDISSFLSSLRNNPDREALFSRYTSLFSKEIWSQVPTEQLTAAVISCGETLHRFITFETKKSKILWVLGM